MIKKNKAYIIILAILVAIVLLAQILPAGKSRVVDLLKINNKYTSKTLRNFEVRDTASVTKIFMVDKNNRTIELNRHKHEWTVNNTYPVRHDAIKLLLETIRTMRVKSPVAISAREEILRRMAGKSIKVEIYQGNKLFKTIYVGGVTQDNLGSYMLLEGSDTPFVIEIPGFRGYLSGRFSTDIKNWRTNVLIGIAPDRIKQVMFDYTNNKKANFTIKQQVPGQYELYDVNNNRATSFDSLTVKGLLEQFEIAHFSSFVDLLGESVKDSVRQTIPAFTISLTTLDNNINNFYFYEIPQLPEDTDRFEKQIYPQSMWVFNNQNEWMIIQTYTYLLMFKEFNDFRPTI